MLTRVNVKLMSHFLNPYKQRVRNSFISPDLFSSQERKKEDMATRLHYEFDYCKSLGGRVFLYTLTYNDKNCPKCLGYNVPDYNDIRYLLHDSFFRTEVKKYCSDLRYFIATELGSDGVFHGTKSKRGYQNNPHYHVIFFSYPSDDGSVLDDNTLYSLLRKYWQGEQYKDCFNVWECINADHGYCFSSGELLTKKALSYSAKYVMKDSTAKSREDEVFMYYYKRFSLHDWTKEQFNSWNEKYFFFTSYLQFRVYVRSHNEKHDELDYYLKIQNEDYAIEYAREKVKEYRNRFTAKCRYSRALGWHNAEIDILSNLNDPCCYSDTKSQLHKKKPVPLGFLRKVYYDKVKDNLGNIRYVLNEKGKAMRLHKFFSKFDSNVEILWSRYRCYYDLQLRDKFNEYCKDNDIIGFQSFPIITKYTLECYLYYNSIYKDRFTDNISRVLTPYSDLEYFLSSDYEQNVFFNELTDIDKYISSEPEFLHLKKYSEHEIFKPLLLHFHFLDTFFSFLDYSSDKFQIQRFEEIQKTHLFHKKLIV